MTGRHTSNNGATMAELVKVGTTFHVNVNGELIQEVRTLHGALCLGFRALKMGIDTNGWNGPCDTCIVYRVEGDKSSAEVVLVADDYGDNVLVVKRWDVKRGHCNLCRWVDDGSQNGRIEMM